MANEVPDAATVKKQILETLNKVKDDEKINFLINRLANIDIETAKARGEAKNFKEQANLVGTVGSYSNCSVLSLCFSSKRKSRIWRSRSAKLNWPNQSWKSCAVSSINPRKSPIATTKSFDKLKKPIVKPWRISKFPWAIFKSRSTVAKNKLNECKMLRIWALRLPTSAESTRNV